MSSNVFLVRNTLWHSISLKKTNLKSEIYKTVQDYIEKLNFQYLPIVSKLNGLLNSDSKSYKIKRITTPPKSWYEAGIYYRSLENLFLII